ncbi:hypothetical protein D3C72_1372280 [compost metagenome]
MLDRVGVDRPVPPAVDGQVGLLVARQPAQVHADGNRMVQRTERMLADGGEHHGFGAGPGHHQRQADADIDGQHTAGGATARGGWVGTGIGLGHGTPSLRVRGRAGSWSRAALGDCYDICYALRGVQWQPSARARCEIASPSAISSAAPQCSASGPATV